MILRKDSWTHLEDAAIIDTVLDYAKRGERQVDAFEYLSNIVPNRTASAVQQRWHKYLRNKVINNPLYNIGTVPQEVKVAVETPEPKQVMLSIAECLSILSCQHLDQDNADTVNHILKKLLKGEG